MAQTTESLPGKSEALSSNSSTVKKDTYIFIFSLLIRELFWNVFNFQLVRWTFRYISVIVVLENKLLYIILLNLLRLVWWPKTWPIFVKVLCVLVKNVYFVVGKMFSFCPLDQFSWSLFQVFYILAEFWIVLSAIE
jgi:hypothetical protein